jgi:hypothetical protein
VTTLIGQAWRVAYRCPVCGFNGLTSKPYATWPPPSGLALSPLYEDLLGRPSYEVCPQCSFEFGNDDNPGTAAPITFEQHRAEYEAAVAAVAAVELIESIRAAGASIGWHPGASVTFLADVEREWPVELRQILRESNGFEDLAGHWEVSWSAERIVEENVQLRDRGVELPTDWLCFGDNGAGDFFALDRSTGGVHVVFGASGETLALAATISEFWLGWFTGRITT